MNVVFGASGLVGSHLVYELVKRGEKLRAVSRSPELKSTLQRKLRHYQDLPENWLDQVEAVQADLQDLPSLEDALEGCTHLYHAAALVSFQAGDYENLYQTNAVGTANLVNVALAKGVQKMAYCSSVAALGKPEHGTEVKENTPWKSSKSNTAYSKSKYAAEREVWRGFEEGLDMVMVNPVVILGPGDYSSGSSALIKTAYSGLRFYPLGSNAIVDVRDVAEILIELCKSKTSAQRFILAGENLSYQSLFSRLAKALGKNPPKYACPPWLGEIAWRLAKVSAFFKGKPPVLTKETARSSQKNLNYNTDKIQEKGFNLRGGQKILDWNSKCYLQDLRDGLIP